MTITYFFTSGSAFNEAEVKELFIEEGRTQGEDRIKTICDAAKECDSDYDEKKVITAVEAIEVEV